MKKFAIKVTTVVDEQFVWDILTTAAEGGIGYWADYSVTRTGPLDVVSVDYVRDLEDEGEGELLAESIGVEEIICAIGKILDENTSFVCDNLLSAVTQNDASLLDAEDCDVIFQYACFGEVVYG